MKNIFAKLKNFTLPFNSVLFILLTVTFFKILPKHSVKFFISELFALNSYIFLALTNKKLLLPLCCRLNTNLFLGCSKLIGYLASAVNVVSSNF